MSRIPDGHRIIKCRWEEGDAHKIGDMGTVVSAIATPESMRGLPEATSPTGEHVEHAYFVAWDDLPGVPVGVVDWKITTAPD